MMKPEKKYSVAGIGELIWDILPEGKMLGGAITNFAYHTNQLGAASYIISSVGNDSLGFEILKKLKNLNQDTSLVNINNIKETGVVNVHLQDGIPKYTIQPDVAWDFISSTEKTELLASECDAVCFGTLAQRHEVSRKSVQNFLKATKPECLRIFDINLRQDFFSKEVIADSLEFASVLKLNDEELPVVAEIFSLKGKEEVVLEKLVKLFELDLVVLTKGGRGSLLKTKEESSFFEAPYVEVKDTVGAGDSFTAAVAMGWLRGKPLSEIHRAATRIAAYVCTSQGATPVLPKELTAMVQ